MFCSETRKLPRKALPANRTRLLIRDRGPNRTDTAPGPRARSAFKQLLGTLNEEERHILITSQTTLLRKREISQMFIDGVLGQDFARALSFYLSCYPDYLKTLQQFA